MNIIWSNLVSLYICHLRGRTLTMKMVILGWSDMTGRITRTGSSIRRTQKNAKQQSAPAIFIDPPTKPHRLLKLQWGGNEPTSSSLISFPEEVEVSILFTLVT